MKAMYSNVKFDSRWTTKFGNIAVSFSVDMAGGRLSRCTAYLKQNKSVADMKLPKGFVAESTLALTDTVEAAAKAIDVTSLPVKEWNYNGDSDKPANEGLVAAATEKFNN